MLINKSDGNDDIMKPPHYYLFKYIYFVSLSVFGIISANTYIKLFAKHTDK